MASTRNFAPGRLSLGEIVEAAEERAASGEKTHPGFDFASLAPSPLKQAAAEHAPAPPNTDAAKVPDPAEGGIEGDLDNAWSRLKRRVNPS